MQQTVKELVDNAVDACRPRVGPPWRSIEDRDPPTVKVVLRRVPGSQRSSSSGSTGVDRTEAGSSGKRTYIRETHSRELRETTKCCDQHNVMKAARCGMIDSNDAPYHSK